MLKNKYAIKRFSVRNRKLKSAGFQSYREFLVSDIWKEIHKRVNVKIMKGQTYWITCKFCRATGRKMQLHHMNYKNVLKPRIGQHIIPLCASCHKSFHDMMEENPKLSFKKVYNICLKNKKRGL